jgi:hypothetical protein
MSRDDSSPVKEEIKQTRAKVPQVTSGLATVPSAPWKKTEGKIIPIISEAHVVPAGVARLVELQEESYTDVKP